jgi:uncharacterized membrane protein
MGVAAMRWSLLLGAILLAYPVLVYLGLSHFEPRVVAVMVILLAIARFAVPHGKGAPSAKLQLMLVLAIALVVGLLSFLSNSPDYLRFYPVCINALMFGLFFASLLRPPSMIERFARLAEPDLPERGVRYTRQVTKVWCGFFVVNGSIALYSALIGSLEFWTLYNGAVAYLLMAALFGGEYLFRTWWRRRGEDE